MHWQKGKNMKIYNNMNITYSAIEQNSRKNTKQNIPADLEKKMTQYTDTLSISKTWQKIFKHLSSVSFIWIMSIGLKMK